jgi:hypothetical protein
MSGPGFTSGKISRNHPRARISDRRMTLWDSPGEFPDVWLLGSDARDFVEIEMIL